MITQLYQLTAPSGKRYIGVTKKPLSYRVKQHYHFQTAIGRALRKYGDRITAEILVRGDEEYIYELERRAIDALGTMAPDGYNLREGGQFSRHTEESKRKIADANRGRIFSEEHKRKIGLASRARKTTEIARHNMSQAQKKRHAEGRGVLPNNKGRPLSEEHKQKIGLGQKRRWARRQ